MIIVSENGIIWIFIHNLQIYWFISKFANFMTYLALFDKFVIKKAAFFQAGIDDDR